MGYKKQISSGRITVVGNKRQCAGLLTPALPDKCRRSAEGSRRGTGEPDEVSQPRGRQRLMRTNGVPQGCQTEILKVSEKGVSVAVVLSPAL